jgi:CheY-like chemotaxis protein
MGGAIHVKSEEGVGSTFEFSIRLARTDAPESRIEVSSVALKAAQGRILLAEDFPMNQELVCAILARDGHVVDVVSNGADAVQAVQKERYDLVLMDIEMPVMDGLTAAREIRKLPGAAGKVPIVALSANVLPDQVRQISDAGMGGNLGKPFRQAELHQTLLKHLGPAPSPMSDEPAVPGVADAAIDESMLESMLKLLPQEKLAGLLGALDERIEKLTLHGASLEPKSLRSLAHGIAGEAGMLGLLRLAKAARAIETPRNGDASQIWAEWLEASEEARNRLRSLVETPR